MDIYDVVSFLVLLLFGVSFISFINEILLVGNFNIHNEGMVFGVFVPKTKSRSVGQLVVCGLISMLMFPLVANNMLSLIFEKFLLFVFYVLIFIIGFIIVSVRKYKAQVKRCAKQTNALILGGLPLVQAADQKILVADEFCVKNDCIKISKQGVTDTIYFTDYGYTSLSEENEHAMLGMYFLQRHHKRFDMKVCMKIVEANTGKIVGTVSGLGINRKVALEEEKNLVRVLDYYQFSAKR